MDYLFPYPKMGFSFLEILEDPLTRKLLGHDAVHAEKVPFIHGVTSRLAFLLNDTSKHLAFLKIGYTALEAFLQANTTGPPLDFDSEPVIFPEAYRDAELPALKDEMRRNLSVDGDAIYALAPRFELFWLAKMVMSNSVLAETGFNGRRARFRVNFWHQKLLSEKSDALREQIYADAEVLELQLGSRYQMRSAAAEEHFVEFLAERAVIRIFYGDDAKAREDLTQAAKIRNFQFALTGALGKRTKYQHRDISQLLVLAKSRDVEPESYSSRKSSRVGASSRKSSLNEISLRSPTSLAIRRASQISVASNAVSDADLQGSGTLPRTNPASPKTAATQPENIPLNDDTILENISFLRRSSVTDPQLTTVSDEASLSPELASLDPSDQAQLFPMDSIILLSTASSISNEKPADGLTREETLPYATRVLEGGSSNWSVYTQALLVRSRIEGYKSRTVERGLLQLQALVDQVIAETSEEAPITKKDGQADVESQTPSTFLPKLKHSESASVAERLKYVYQLSPPLRWQLEAELAQRWTQLGGLRSALEIYERLQMKAEVALCLAATDQEAEATKLLRDMLFVNADDKSQATLRSPPPGDAPRLLCILGDIEQDPKYYVLGWQVSNQRYARAQRSLGKYYASRKKYALAAEAYTSALKITRLDNATWFALGCIQIQLEDWPGAVETFTRCISLEDQDAEAWSNLAVALMRLPSPVTTTTEGATIPEEDEKDENGDETKSEAVQALGNDQPRSKSQSPPPSPKSAIPTQRGRSRDPKTSSSSTQQQDPYTNTRSALRALQKAAQLKRDDARIWDNYLTVAASIPPSSSQGTPWNDMIQAFTRVIELRSPKEGESSIDLKILGVLIKYVTEVYEYPSVSSSSSSSEQPAAEPTANPAAEVEADKEGKETQGQPNPTTLPFLPRTLLSLVDKSITPLSSSNPQLFTLLSRLSLWRHRPHESLIFAEKSHRATTSLPNIYDSLAGFDQVVDKAIDLCLKYRDLGDKERERTGGKVEANWKGKIRILGRGVLARGRKEGWEGSEAYQRMKEIVESCI